MKEYKATAEEAADKAAVEEEAAKKAETDKKATTVAKKAVGANTGSADTKGRKWQKKSKLGAGEKQAVEQAAKEDAAAEKQAAKQAENSELLKGKLFEVRNAYASTTALRRQPEKGENWLKDGSDQISLVRNSSVVEVVGQYGGFMELKNGGWIRSKNLAALVETDDAPVEAKQAGRLVAGDLGEMGIMAARAVGDALDAHKNSAAARVQQAACAMNQSRISIEDRSSNLVGAVSKSVAETKSKIDCKMLQHRSKLLGLSQFHWCIIDLPPPVDVLCVQPESYQIGLDLHHSVPPSMWCITEEDFDTFVTLVALFHREGKIPNDPGPDGVLNPHHDDSRIGPNMYQVNKYVIQPVTLARGGASWALMQHPAGLQIDFFVTHGWAEGIYEFSAKVKRSWPSGKNGWICFLANPQPWPWAELAQLIGSAEDMTDSPFVQAIENPTCTMMLVVPNVKESIYTRLWCIEEARRAIAKKMEIRLAWINIMTPCPAIGRILRQHEEGLKAFVESRASPLLQTTFVQKSVEHIRKLKTGQVRQELQKSFTTVANAKCSCSDDERRIRAAMSGLEHQIDEMVNNLITRGTHEQASQAVNEDILSAFVVDESP